MSNLSQGERPQTQTREPYRKDDEYILALEDAAEALEKHHYAARLITSRIYGVNPSRDEGADLYADAITAGTAALARLRALRAPETPAP